MAAHHSTATASSVRVSSRLPIPPSIPALDLAEHAHQIRRDRLEVSTRPATRRARSVCWREHDFSSPATRCSRRAGSHRLPEDRMRWSTRSRLSPLTLTSASCPATAPTTIERNGRGSRWWPSSAGCRSSLGSGPSPCARRHPRWSTWKPDDFASAEPHWDFLHPRQLGRGHAAIAQQHETPCDQRPRDAALPPGPAGEDGVEQATPVAVEHVFLRIDAVDDCGSDLITVPRHHEHARVERLIPGPAFERILGRIDATEVVTEGFVVGKEDRPELVGLHGPDLQPCGPKTKRYKINPGILGRYFFYCY